MQVVELGKEPRHLISFGHVLGYFVAARVVVYVPVGIDDLNVHLVFSLFKFIVRLAIGSVTSILCLFSPGVAAYFWSGYKSGAGRFV
jgi:hypothetical protein